MILGLGQSVELWEAVAALQIIQALPEENTISHESAHCELFEAAGLGISNLSAEGSFNFDRAFRVVDTGQLPYCDVLASMSGLEGLRLGIPKLPNVQAADGGAILVCPFGLRTEFDLPYKVWASVIKQLRSYDLPVLLMGNPGQRMDVAGFMESELLGWEPLSAKIKMLAEARLIVGVPNAWIWIATAWDKRMVMLYPDKMPGRRWFPWVSDSFGRLIYESHQLQIPVILAGLRRLISIL